MARSGVGGFRSGRAGLPSSASAVTLREKTRARATSLGLDAEWCFEALGENATMVQCDTTGAAADSGGWISVDANLGGASATLTIYQALVATRLALNSSNISYVFA